MPVPPRGEQVPLTKKIDQITVPLNEHVDLHINRLVINPDAGPSQRFEAVEVRQYIKESASFGHGVTIPAREVKDVALALQKILED